MHTTADSPSATRLPARMTLRVPRGLPEAIEAAARRQLTSPTEYARRALVAALRSDGVRLRPDGRVVEQQEAA
jgi:hypothetical protein